MEKYTMFLHQNNKYSENEYTTQSNLQIQCNPYQATNGIFQRTRTNDFTICMEIQKTYVPVFLENLHGMSCSGTCWLLGGAWCL